jgi:hypothetical protein
MNDDLSHVMPLLLRLLRHRNRMPLVSCDLPVLSLCIRLMLRLALVLGSSPVTVPTETLVALLLDLVHLAVFEVRAGAEHPGNTDESDKEEADLDEGLTGVELFSRVDLFEVCQMMSFSSSEQGK